jgi:hypothetical protein
LRAANEMYLFRPAAPTTHSARSRTVVKRREEEEEERTTEVDMTGSIDSRVQLWAGGGRALC